MEGEICLMVCNTLASSIIESRETCAIWTWIHITSSQSVDDGMQIGLDDHTVANALQPSIASQASHMVIELH